MKMTSLLRRVRSESLLGVGNVKKKPFANAHLLMVPVIVGFLSVIWVFVPPTVSDLRFRVTLGLSLTFMTLVFTFLLLNLTDIKAKLENDRKNNFVTMNLRVSPQMFHEIALYIQIRGNSTKTDDNDTLDETFGKLGILQDSIALETYKNRIALAAALDTHSYFARDEIT